MRNSSKIAPVKQIETFKLPENRPITEQLKEKLSGITENKDSDYKNWIYVIPLEGK